MSEEGWRMETKGLRRTVVEPTRGADTRSAAGEVSKEVLLRESHLHRSHVRKVMAALAAELLERAERHDETKVSPEGIEGFHDAFTRTMRKEVEFKNHPWWTLHLTEKHHLNDRLHEDADLLDLLEMVVDCACAGMARTGTVFPIAVPDATLQHLLRNMAAKVIGSIDVAAPAGEG
jgi:hypothetical protein